MGDDATVDQPPSKRPRGKRGKNKSLGAIAKLRKIRRNVRRTLNTVLEIIADPDSHGIKNMLGIAAAHLKDSDMQLKRAVIKIHMKNK